MADPSIDLSTTLPIDPVLGQRLLDILAPAVELEDNFVAQHRLPVHAQSRLRADESVGNAASAFRTASIAVVGALDHLCTWHQLIAGDLNRFPLRTFSPYTLARAAYEPALLTLWLLDSDASSAERIGRGYAAQLRSLREVRKFQAAVGMTGDSANATALHQRLFNGARAAGYVTTDAKGVERLTVNVPPMVDLFNRYDQPTPAASQPEWLYRFLSGHAHGFEWAMIRGATEADLDGFDTDKFMIPVDLLLLCHLADRTVAVVSRAVAAHLRYRTDPLPG
ncbi:hypothetical protein [Rugosimonospora africana]|uniref:Uncharacterized protein n=1 Tax=Rugosimonospora africana TaxID=556532 RepID=A0A8J3VUS3_9ACTN|nr:hypothetical protein [Rugosimonospora africana]GIH19164.1 hypothetical protein Raf01_73360 [Rugosimonospora africana]